MLTASVRQRTDAGLAPDVDLWCRDALMPASFVYPSRSGAWGCGVVLANATGAAPSSARPGLRPPPLRTLDTRAPILYNGTRKHIPVHLSHIAAHRYPSSNPAPQCFHSGAKQP
jgi:hypothetical protein